LLVIFFHCRLPTIGCWLLVACCLLLGSGFRVLGSGCWFAAAAAAPAAEDWLLVSGLTQFNQSPQLTQSPQSTQLTLFVDKFSTFIEKSCRYRFPAFILIQFFKLNLHVMKAKAIVLIGLLAVILSGCLVKSLHSFFNESDVVYKPELNGTWIDDDSARWVITQFTFSKKLFEPDSLDNSYLVELYENSERPSRFNVHLFMVDGLWYLDFFPIKEDSDQEYFIYHFVPAHSLARIRFDNNNSISISWFGEDWLQKLFEENRVKISHEVVRGDETGYGTQYILTASTDELKKFLAKYGDDPNVFNEEDDKNFLTLKLNRTK
jgi:hypothetical protein